MLRIPSRNSFYLTKNGTVIPETSKIEEEQQDIDALKSLKSDNFDYSLNTCYAINKSYREGDTIDLSLKENIRQRYRPDYFFFNDWLKALSYSPPAKSLHQIYTEFCRFPCNPNSNIFYAARLAIEFDKSGDRTDIDKYLESCELKDYQYFSLDIYPVYYLFFFLTRFYSYPFTDYQLRALQERISRREFVDSIFDIEYDPRIFDLTNEELKSMLETPYDDWTKWAVEYLLQPKNKAELKLDEYHTTSELQGILETWSDNDIVEFAKKITIRLPERKIARFRSMWIGTIAEVLFTLKLFGEPRGEIPPPIQIFEEYQTIIY